MDFKEENDTSLDELKAKISEQVKESIIENCNKTTPTEENTKEKGNK